MSIKLTTRAASLLAQTNLNTQLILEIDGFSNVFGAKHVNEYIKVGREKLEIGNTWSIGGVAAMTNSRDWMSLGGGTTTKITQQLKQDGSTSSVTTMKVVLLDKNETLSSEFSPGVIVDDILSREANIYLALDEFAFPEDAVKIFSGVISAIEFGAGNAAVEVSHPERFKRQDIFPQYNNQLKLYTGKLSSGISDSDNSLTLTNTDDFVYDGSDSNNNNILIDTEIIKVTSDPGSSGTCSISRGQHGTTPIAHSADDEISMYTLYNTKFPVEDTTNLIASNSIITTYVKIDDEVMKVASFDSTTLTVSRLTEDDRLNTTKNTHEDEAAVTSFYRLQDDPIDAALKIMLSNGGTSFQTDVDIDRFVQVDASTNVANSFFISKDPEEYYGLVKGDLVTITGASSGVNNVTSASISSFGKLDSGYYIVLTGVSLTAESDSSAKVSFKSQYNVLHKNMSLGMNPKHVDVAQHLTLKTILSTSLPTYDLYIDDTIDGQELINRKMYWPVGLYSINRKGKASVNASVPPLAETDTKTLDANNILNASSLRIKRTVNDKFYNSITYKYSPHAKDMEYKAGLITSSEDSENRIKLGTKTMTIEAPGFRRNATTLNYLKMNSRRQLQRYRFGAEHLTVLTNYKTGMNLDIGDTLILKGDEVKITDSLNGSTDFSPRIFEVFSKSLDVVSGKITLNLVDTIYDTSTRFGVISPSSVVGSSSTTSKVYITQSFASETITDEVDKWSRYEGLDILIRSSDFSYSQECRLVKSNPAGYLEVTGLSVAPDAGAYVEPPNYDETSAVNEALYKVLHCYLNPQVAISSAANDTSFVVGGSDISKFKVNHVVMVHSSDYTSTSDDVKIKSVDAGSNTVTVEKSLGFTPSSGQFVELIGYGDGGAAYAYI